MRILVKEPKFVPGEEPPKPADPMPEPTPSPKASPPLAAAENPPKQVWPMTVHIFNFLSFFGVLKIISLRPCESEKGGYRMTWHGQTHSLIILDGSCLSCLHVVSIKYALLCNQPELLVKSWQQEPVTESQPNETVMTPVEPSPPSDANSKPADTEPVVDASKQESSPEPVKTGT